MSIHKDLGDQTRIRMESAGALALQQLKVAHDVAQAVFSNQGKDVVVAVAQIIATNYQTITK
ncbi:hypothetical protein [Burkholderia glumae]|uniref:hypothetical protein n=1 Tax=Burkholderia glumae TaxID=337 RepID=UPI00054ADD0B|nr:hypothetical protein [Burkholderia glumae]KHJ63124.1 hypothetical protein NCPPB3923_09815 [Burkholderia glumae]